jgi:hypothetical protein
MSKANLLREHCAAVKVSFTWFGTSRALTKDQKQAVANQFAADPNFISTGKKILDRTEEAFAKLTSIKGEITDYWKRSTLPYVEDGVRLLRKDNVEAFDQQMRTFSGTLSDAAYELEYTIDIIKERMKLNLGPALYNDNDYPTNISQKFAVAWSFPSTEPPNYLAELNPALFEEERRRVAARFDEAVTLTEQAFAEEFAKLVAHLAERLKPGEDGKPKGFKDSSLDNLKDFFDRFRQLNVTNNEQLEALVNRAQQTVGSVEGKELRKSEQARADIANTLDQLSQDLGAMIAPRKRRSWTPLNQEQEAAA